MDVKIYFRILQILNIEITPFMLRKICVVIEIPIS